MKKPLIAVRTLTVFDGAGNVLATEQSTLNDAAWKWAIIAAHDVRQLGELAKKYPTATIGTIDRAKFAVVKGGVNFVEYAP